ncbi:MAG: helix-turn-helix transcriptional regulator [Gordonibacter sp.]|uniref:helix-turn-helix domain-containing protein n=1 Tax=Gordonibacter sp. TaxID=1968902 RepID=UPI002FC981E0
MAKLYERIRQARTELHLSQDYVARYLGIGRSAVAEMEANKRKVSAEELGKLSDLFLIPADELLSGKKIDSPSQVFARNFESLGESDQQEILNLMKFKQAMKERQ